MTRQPKSRDEICQAITKRATALLLDSPHRTDRHPVVWLLFKQEPGFEGNWQLDLSNVEEPYLSALSKAVEEVKEVYCCPMLPQAYTGQQRHRGEGLA